ncbi:hypothetical protein FXF53_18410 [Micromonospora sp. WP24]|uniref:hypothetical protein n=1 Tax=Micromonospora sp. WP24 TaxID=2604469 RepID=UPI0011D7ADF0|nr:hypothetical protein [Micromonospora sp. WP24]TYB98099.1 hypothetical protein FXF53_18410 [Micromonospora sp. WP24]
MLDEATTAIITGAAGNIVAYMLNGRADALRNWVSKVFHDGSTGGSSASLRALEKDSLALGRGAASESDVKARWAILLTSLLTAHPELRSEIGMMAATPVDGGMINVGSQHNYGPGTFIGGNNYGGITGGSS